METDAGKLVKNGMIKSTTVDLLVKRLCYVPQRQRENPMRGTLSLTGVLSMRHLAE